MSPAEIRHERLLNGESTAPMARCGSIAPHGAHLVDDHNRMRFCAGNQNIIEPAPQPLTECCGAAWDGPCKPGCVNATDEFPDGPDGPARAPFTSEVIE